MPLDTSCLYSTVKNVAHGPRTFSFLPPHGRKLEANEEYTIFGDIREAMYRFDHGGSGRRNALALEAALKTDLEIIHTPGVILTDDANPGGESKRLKLHNGTLGVASACWNVSVSDEAEFGG